MGSYTVAVSNVVGTLTSAAATVSLNVPVAISVQPLTSGVNPGATKTLSVAATGTAPLTYQWRRNGVALAGATSASYALTNAGLETVGVYEVVITNPVGSLISAPAAITLNSAVTLLTQPASTKVNPGKSVALTVAAAGTAPFTYQWRKEGVAISGATAATYSIASAKVANTGSYDVVVTNPVGSVTSNAAVLSLNSPVAFTSQPVAVVANPFAPASLSVTATGTTPLTYQWRKGGVAIPGATSSTYAVAATQSGDVGTYDVVVSNIVGSAISSTAKISLNSAVTITSQPASVSLSPGVSKTWSVTATGTAPLSYQWRKGGVAIPGATSASYVIPSVQSTDAGIYDVTVSNVVGAVSSNPAVLTLNTPVSIAVPPASVTLSPGAVLSLSVTATGTAPITYQWRRNGAALSGATSASYTIASVAAANAGSYDVIVSNVVGGVTSSSAAVVVNSPVTLTSQPVGGSINPGASKTFSVAATGTAPIAYQWRRNGLEIPEATSSSYTIASAQNADAAGYDVVVSNLVNTVTSSTAVLALNVPAAIVTQPLGATINPGISKTFTVAASGTSPFTYQWRKNGANIAGATSASYTVTSAQLANAGTYTVVVGNAVSSVTSDSAVLSVNVPVTILAQPTGLTVDAGAPAQLSVTASGTAPLTYQWRKAGVNIAGATSSVLAFSEAQIADASSYTVVVTNAVGSVTSSAAALAVNPTVTKTLYKYIAGTFTWAQAKADAEFKGGHLATITTPAEWSALSVQLSTNASKVLWLGGFQATGATEPAGGWQWVTGESFDYTRWGAGQPSDTAGLENYLALNATGLVTGTWNDTDATGGGKVVGYVLEQEPVVLSSILQAQAANLGGAVSWTVSASGATPITYQWRKNGVAIAGATASSYSLSAVTAANSGIYDVIVSNPCGSLTSNGAQLSVNLPVTITTQPQSVLVNPAAPVRLSVSATGTEPFTYQWRRNGATIEGATSAAFELPAVQVGDSGSYDVVVGNVFGTLTSSAATVVVNTPLSITTEPQGGALNPTSSFTLSVGVAGTTPVSYQWRRDGVPIAGATSATYTVTSTLVAGTAVYDVVATNVVGSVTSAGALLSSNVPVAVTQPPVSLSVNPGFDAVFTVAASGTAPLAYQWRRNGAALPGQTGSSLILSGVQAANAGSYDVVVSNVVGSATSTAAVLSVNTPVSITTQPAATALNLGASTTFTVKASGTAPLTYQWYRNGEAIANATTSSLALGPVQDADAGVYQVVISNVVGSVTSFGAQLTINTPPSIQLDPTSLSVNAASAASFTVSAAGTAPLTYQWRKNGTPITGATSSSYSIASVQALHAAAYDVVVTNVAGSVISAPATLALNVPLNFTTQPAGAALNPGAAATLSAVVEGTGPISYQWRRNGSAIEGATNPAYVIPSASDSDAATYDVVAYNVVGSLGSNKAVVTINTAVAITQQPASLSMNPGSITTLTVAATGTAPLTYQWSKDGSPIPGANAASFVLSNVQALDTGTYAVVVGNVVGSVSSAAAEVFINTPVTISAQPEGVQLTAGSAALLSVTASGTAPLTYQWFKNGAAIAGANANTFAIASAKVADAATYEVAVSNVVGTVGSAKAVVGLNVPVSITAQPVNFTSMVGSSMSLTVAASGTGPLTYQWRKGGVDLPGQNSATLTFSPVQLSDAGAYDVVVSNIVGSVTSSAALVAVEDPPVITTALNSATVKAGTSLTLTTTVSGTGPFTYQWRKDGMPLAGANALSYSIPMVDESFAGIYDIVVTGPSSSVVSPGATLTVISISTGPPVLMNQPANAVVAWGKTATLSAMVTATKPFSYQWYKIGVTDTLVSSGSSAAGTGLLVKYIVAAAKDTHEGLYELRLKDFEGKACETTLPCAIRLNLAFGDARLLLKGWSQDLSSLQTDLLATIVLPTSVPPDDTLRLGIRTAAAATYAWVHKAGNGTITRLTSQTGPTLSFKDVIRLKGYYILTVTTGTVSRSLTFQVLSFATTNIGTGGLTAPTITYNPESLTVPLGSAADFGVTAIGSVRGYIWWKQVGTVETALTAAGSSPWLTIDQVGLSDAATYYAEVLSADPLGASVKSTPAVLEVVPPGE